jgi:GNAT superfamily N-acetyltransferase
MTTSPAEGARPARAADLEAIVRLCGQLLAEVSEQRGGELASLTGSPASGPAEILRDALASERHHVVVGTLDDEVVGALVAHLVELADGRLLASVDLLYVEPGARFVGVGEALVASLVRWSREHRCVGMDVPALPGMRETKNFLEGAGFVTRLLVMHRELGG